VPDAVHLLGQIAPIIGDAINPRLGPDFGKIVVASNYNSAQWTGLAYGAPFLTVVTNTNPQILFGGFGPHVPTRNDALPSELKDHVTKSTNLVFFDWEITGQNLAHVRYLDDVYRLVFDSWGPRLTPSASVDWVAKNLTNLSHSVTELKLDAPSRLNLVRKSTIGMTSWELDALANWLEVPQFPWGLQTMMATNPAPRPNLRNRKPAPSGK
jgi:hypothetical protein